MSRDTKHEAALRCLGLAWLLHKEARGDGEVDAWIVHLLWIAERLDERILQHSTYAKVLNGAGTESRQTKLRRLIEHEGTPPAEREAALAALGRISD